MGGRSSFEAPDTGNLPANAGGGPSDSEQSHFGKRRRDPLTPLPQGVPREAQPENERQRFRPSEMHSAPWFSRPVYALRERVSKLVSDGNSFFPRVGRPIPKRGENRPVKRSIHRMLRCSSSLFCRPALIQRSSFSACVVACSTSHRSARGSNARHQARNEQGHCRLCVSLFLPEPAMDGSSVSFPSVASCGTLIPCRARPMSDPLRWSVIVYIYAQVFLRIRPTSARAIPDFS